MKNTILVLSVFAFITSSCKETKKAIETAGNIILDGSYIITSIKGDNITPVASITFSAAEKTVSGNSGCNDFSGNYSLDSLAINFGQIMTTESYCDDPIMKNERALLKVLKETGTYSVADGIVTLYSKTDRSALLKATKK